MLLWNHPNGYNWSQHYFGHGAGLSSDVFFPLGAMPSMSLSASPSCLSWPPPDNPTPTLYKSLHLYSIYKHGSSFSPQLDLNPLLERVCSLPIRSVSPTIPPHWPRWFLSPPKLPFPLIIKMNRLLLRVIFFYLSILSLWFSLGTATLSDESTCDKTGTCTPSSTHHRTHSSSSSPFLTTIVRPFDRTHFSSEKFDFKYSLYNVAFINGTLHVYAGDSPSRYEKLSLAASRRSGFLLHVGAGRPYYRMEWKVERGFLDKEWCKEQGEWVEEDVFFYNPFLGSIFFHLIQDIHIPLFYNVLHSRHEDPHFNFSLLPVSAYEHNTHVWEAVDELMETIPRRVYRIEHNAADRYLEDQLRMRLPLHPALSKLFQHDIDSRRASLMKDKDDLMKKRDEDNSGGMGESSRKEGAREREKETPRRVEWYRSSKELEHGVTCMRHFRWGEGLKPFQDQGAYFPFHQGHHGVAHLYARTVLKAYGIERPPPLPSSASTSPSSSQSVDSEVGGSAVRVTSGGTENEGRASDDSILIVYMKRTECKKNGRCLLNKVELQQALQRKFGSKATVKECCDYEDISLSLSLLSQADILIGPHGSNLAGLVFMKPGGLVVELKIKLGVRNFCYRYETYQVCASILLSLFDLLSLSSLSVPLPMSVFYFLSFSLFLYHYLSL